MLKHRAPQENLVAETPEGTGKPPVASEASAEGLEALQEPKLEVSPR